MRKDRNNRPLLTFSLSFLDVMSVGLGSVILIFLIINHASEVRSRQATAEQQAEVEAMQAEFDALEATAEALASAVEKREEELQGARARLAELQRMIAADPDRGADPARREEIERLQNEVRALEAEVAELRRESAGADSVLARAGDGRRQYLTGLDVSGKRILILMDISASMLAETIVDAIRLRNMDASAIASAGKWRRGLDAAAWMAAQIPPGSAWQLYVFNEQARSVVPETTGRWLRIGDGSDIADAIRRLRETRPGGGTSLHNAFRAAAQLDPAPDSIILITDHTPTVGASGSRRGRVSAEQRRRLFEQAFERLPRGVPVNVLLFPMEGDPMAASLFWQLAQVTGGVMISPSHDWP